MKTKASFKFFCSLFAFMITLGSQAQWIQIGSDIDGKTASESSAFSISMPDASTIAVGAPYNSENGTNRGKVRIYLRNGVAWVQKGADIEGEAAGDYSGQSVSMPDANTVAIGAPYNAGNGVQAGHVRIYSWNGSAWMQKGNDIDGEAGVNYSGYSVSMPDSNTVAIGAPYNADNGSNAGHARIYSWNGSAWVQKGTDIDGEAANDYSGYSVSMPDINTIAIGAPFNSGKGHARIFSWSGTAWIQKGTSIIGETAGDRSGSSVNMPDSNTIAIGAPYNDGNGTDAGQVRIYSWNGSAWMQSGADIDGEAASNYSGLSVNMPDSNTVAIAAPENSGGGSFRGHVRIYSRNGGGWIQNEADIEGEANNDVSGNSVSMPDANTIAIGAYNNDGNGTNSGHVRIYHLCKISSSVSSQTSVMCNGESTGTASINTPTGGTGNYTYDWSPGTPSGDGTVTVSGLAAGSYTCVITDDIGCSASQVFTISEPAVLSASSAITNSVSCHGGSNGEVTASAIGGVSPYTYSWQGTGESTAAVSGLSAGSFTCTVTDDNGCTATTSITLTAPNELTSTPTKTDVLCNAASTGMAGSGVSGGVQPMSFLWNNSETTSSISGLAAGTYSVLVTDNNGCTAAGSVTITEEAAFVVVTGSMNTTCHGSNDGWASVSVSGAVMPYQYSWSNNGMSDTTKMLIPGTYTCTITDANNCTVIASATVTEPAPVVISLSVGTEDTVCSVHPPISLTASPSGGTFSGTGVSSGNFDPATANADWNVITYDYTDNNGCMASARDSIYINICTGFAESVSNAFEVYPNPSNGIIQIKSSGIHPYTALTVRNLLGENVYSIPLTSPMQAIDLTDQPKGFYLVQLHSQESNSTRLIIIQ